MKSKVLLSAFFAFAVLAMPLCEASILVNTRIQIDTNLPGSSGGRFAVNNPGGQISGAYNFGGFETFCVEVEEHITQNGVYRVKAISTQNSSGKTLGSQAAWLYTQFRAGTLTGFETAGANATNDANALQYGIWQGMGYSDTDIASNLGISASSLNSTYKNHWTNSGWATDFANSGWTGIGQVRVMQLKGSAINSTANHQDQLLLIPEPGSLAIWGLVGLGCTVMTSRRRRLA